MEEFIQKLVHLGLKGLEVYYPDHTDEHIILFKDLAEKYGLFPTGGSDFHGENKPDVEMGVFKGGTNLSRSLINTLKAFNPCT